NLIPLAATGLLAIALLPVLDVMPERQALSLFGNSAVFFMLGVFLLAGAMISTGLSKRVTLLALQRFDRSPTTLVVGVTVSASFMALWMPEHAVAAMMFPIITEIVDSLGLQKGSNYAKKLFLGLAWGSVIGGVGTFLGGARAPLALSILQQTYPGKSIGFLHWMAASAPIVMIMTALAVWIVCSRVPADVRDIKAATRMLDERVRRLGPMSSRERRLAALGLLTIITWISVGHAFDLGVVAMLSASLLFILRIADWNAVQGFVNWGVLLMYGGAVALGRAITETHAMEWLLGHVFDAAMPGVLALMIMAAIAIILTEGISNAAAVAVLLPIGYSVGDMMGVGPAMMTLAVTIPSGLAFLLPVGSPPNAICFASGHYSIRQVVQWGWPLTLCGLLLIFAVIVVWWGLVLNINAW
ncbi:MAG: DASS family sodium-coupled anion symporter, partial [Phycisphaerae bacterium]